MKRLRLICYLCILMISATVIMSCGPIDTTDNPKEIVNELVDRLKAVDSSAALHSTSNYYKVVYSNDVGDEIYFYNIKTEYYGEAKEVTGIHFEAISSVISPIVAEQSQELKIKEQDAIIISSDGKEYLCWTISPEDSCVIEYDPKVFSLEDIITMAESVY